MYWDDTVGSVAYGLATPKRVGCSGWRAIGMSLLLFAAVVVALLAPVATGTVTGIALVGLAVLVMAVAAPDSQGGQRST